jgi:hypothetical protein
MIEMSTDRAMPVWWTFRCVVGALQSTHAPTTHATTVPAWPFAPKGPGFLQLAPAAARQATCMLVKQKAAKVRQSTYSCKQSNWTCRLLFGHSFALQTPTVIEGEPTRTIDYYRPVRHPGPTRLMWSWADGLK